MGLFNLFGGKKKNEARAGAARPVEAKPAKADVKPAVAQAPAAAKPAPQIALAISDAGVMQVKLRLKLAASLRAGQHAEAYKAAKDLAAIQAKAGRRVGARVWSAEADRILAEHEAA